MILPYLSACRACALSCWLMVFFLLCRHFLFLHQSSLQQFIWNIKCFHLSIYAFIWAGKPLKSNMQRQINPKHLRPQTVNTEFKKRRKPQRQSHRYEHPPAGRDTFTASVIRLDARSNFSFLVNQAKSTFRLLECCCLGSASAADAKMTFHCRFLRGFEFV